MKKIKAVEMVREIRDRIFEETKNMQGEARRQYFKHNAQWIHVENHVAPAHGPQK